MTSGVIPGRVFAWRIGDIGDIGMGYYRSSAVHSSVFVFSAQLLNPSFGGNSGYGYSVLRFVIIHQFFFLGSYGLAEGNSTNVGTPVSALDLFKTGWYFVGESESSGTLTNRSNHGYFWFSTATMVDSEARRMYYGENALQIGVRYKYGAGYSVRCAFERLR